MGDKLFTYSLTLSTLERNGPYKRFGSPGEESFQPVWCLCQPEEQPRAAFLHLPFAERERGV